MLRQLAQNELTRTYLAAATNAAGERTFVRLELLRKELAADAGVRALFLEHAAAVISLRHPTLAEASALVADDGDAGLCVEFIDGQPLTLILERVGRGELPLELHLRILCSVLDGLHHAHQHQSESAGLPGLVHGNVSPSDVFVTYDGQVKVTGIGLSAARHAMEQKRGGPRGDVGYRAPEVLLGYPPSREADVYGVGVMLWEALAQCRRSLALDPRSIAKQRTRGEEPDIDEVSTGAPKRLRAICRRALAVSRRDRHDTALAFKLELESYLAEASAPGAEASRAELAQLLCEHFEREREEMQLFTGTSNMRRPDPAPILARTAPQKASDSGEHRAFSTSLLTAPAPRRHSRKWWGVLATVAGLALVIGITARWLEHARSSRSTSAELALRSAGARGPAQQRTAELSTVETEVRAATESASVATSASPALSEQAPPEPPSSAFLALSGEDGGFVFAPTAPFEPPALHLDDLPALNGDRWRLQETLVGAARRYRLRLARRDAELRAAQRAKVQAAAADPSPPPLVEINPYDP